jgi:shikimate dehydrogenase
LEKLNIGFDIVSRKLHDGSSLTYDNLDEKIMKENLIIINTTPVGMFPNNNECPDIPYQFITEKHLLYDLIYNPAKTLFLQKGKDKGATIKNGEEMLLLQAEESWKIWNE